MNGKITMSRRGRTGSTSGIFGCSSSLSRLSSSFLSSSFLSSSFLTSSVIGEGSLFFFPGDGDDGLAAPSVLEARKGDRQQASREVGRRLRHVHGRVEEDRAREAPVRPLHAQEAGHAGAALPPLPAHHHLAVA